MNDKLDRFDITFFSQAVEDFERTQFRFFAALQAAEEMIDQRYVFPLVKDMIRFNERIEAFLERVDKQEKGWPTDLVLTRNQTGYDMHYELQPDAPSRGEVGELIKFIDKHRPNLERKIEKGRDVVNLVNHQIDLVPIGLLPPRKTDGFLIMKPGEDENVFVARYHLLATAASTAQERSVRLRRINFSNYGGFTKQDEKKSPVRTVADALVTKSDLKHPACFEINVDGDIPFSQTTLPVVQKRLREVA